MKYSVTVNETVYEVDVNNDGTTTTVKLNGKQVDFKFMSGRDKHHFLMLLDAKTHDTEVFEYNGFLNVFMHGHEFECYVEDQRLVEIRKAAGMKLTDHHKELHAPMPGLVMRILKNVGDQVKKGDSVMVVEAMKMENELKSPTDGVIKDIHAVAGKPVDKGAILITFT